LSSAGLAAFQGRPGALQCRKTIDLDEREVNFRSSKALPSRRPCRGGIS